MTSSGLRSVPVHVWVGVASWGVSLVFCGSLWFARIGGDLRALNNARKKLATERSSLEVMKRDVGVAESLKRDVAVQRADLYAITNTHTLTPLLNSYAMRAKELLSPAAAASGFSIGDVRERYRVPLPTASLSVDLFFDRIGIEIAGVGSYREIADFVAEVERTLPYASLAGLTLNGQRTDPLRHRAAVVLEWPAQGTKPLPAPEAKAGARKKVRKP